jgi:hypothetical protein
MITEEIDPGLRERFRANWSGCLGGAAPEEDCWQTINKVISSKYPTPEGLKG